MNMRRSSEKSTRRRLRVPALSIGEATSVLSAAVVIVTFFIGRVSVSKTSSAKEQRTEDKLDSLCGDTS